MGNPIIEFKQRENDELKTTGGGNNQKPQFVLTGKELEQHITFLSGRLKDLEVDWEIYENNNFSKPIEVKIVDKAKAKSHQKRIIDLFSSDFSFSQIGMENDNSLILKIKNKAQLDKIDKEIRESENSDVVVSAIKDIGEYTPKFESADNNSDYKVFFLDFNDKSENENSKKYIEEELAKNDINFKNATYGSSDILVLNNLSLDKLTITRKLPIKSITPVKKVSDFFRLDDLNQNLFSKLDSLQYDDSVNYPVVGVLDNGIEINKYTRNWVVRGVACPYSDQQLSCEHGTFIASVLIYGDLLNNTHDFDIQGCKIVDCPVVPNFAINEIELVNNIKNAVQSNPDVKVWNLSVSIGDPIEENGFSSFAKELDKIQEDNAVLIIKSAGNDGNNVAVDSQPEKINQGGDSLRALTVGAINKDSDKEHGLVANSPAFYSRKGLGPAYNIKPEVVHYGGDAYFDNGNIVKKSIFGFSTSGEFKIEIGTSFSTPKVAKNISCLDTMMVKQNFDPILLKALTIHSAKYDKDISLSEIERIERLGFGKPQKASEILNTTDHAVTLILNGDLQKSSRIDIMDFPYPDSLIDENGHYYGIVDVTLVYDPYLAPDMGNEYCQNEIDLKFGTFSEKRDVVGPFSKFNPIKRVDSQNLLKDTLYSKRSLKNNYTYEKTRIEYGRKYQPVKHYSIDLATLSNANKKYLDAHRNFYLYLEGIYRNFIVSELEKNNKHPHTRFSLIITISDPNKEKNVYHDTIAKLTKNNFIHSAVATEIQIDV